MVERFTYLDIYSFEPTNQNSLKVPKVFFFFNFLKKKNISEIEQLQVDKKNRPLVDARIFNSGELIPKCKVAKECFHENYLKNLAT